MILALTFQVQPELLFNYLEELECQRTCLPTQSADYQHLHQLIKFLSNHFVAALDSLRPLLQHGEITFDLLWALFKPNDLLYTTCIGTGKPRSVRFESGEERTVDGVRFFQLKCRYLDYNGKSFGEAWTLLAIEEFRGVKRIDTLDVFPLHHHPQESELRSLLTQQGVMFVALMGVQHREYEGDAFFIRKGELDVVKVKGRVMIDAGSFRDVNPTYSKLRVNEPLKTEAYAFCCIVSPSDKDSETLASNKIQQEDLAEDDLMTCSATVMGYSLVNKMWCEYHRSVDKYRNDINKIAVEFAVANIKNIEWNKGAFRSLELAEDQKKVLQALVESQLRHESEVRFDDFIEGKGQGIITLLQYDLLIVLNQLVTAN